MGIEIEGEGTIIQTELSIEEIRDNIAAQVALELSIVWEQIKDLAIIICPKETGALASSIMTESEGGGGAIMAGGEGGGTGTMRVGGGDGDFYNNAIFAGSSDVINSKSGLPTSFYALFVHDGHTMPDGNFYEGVPFLTDAVMAYQDELDTAVDRAMSENDWNTQG